MLAALGIVAISAAITPAAGSEAEPGIRNEGCSGIQIAIRVPKDQVEPLVPTPFEIKVNQGKARFSVTMEKCDSQSIEGGEPFEDTVFFHADVDIECPEAFAGPCPDVEDIREPHAYGLWGASDNPELVSYLRRQGAPQSTLVSDLVYEVGEDGSFRFEASAPAPSPFTVTAQLTPASPVGITITPRGYSKQPRGVMIIDDDIVTDLRVGAITDWSIVPAQGSPLDLLLCNSPRSFIDANAGLDDESIHATFESATLTPRLHETKEIGDTEDAQCDSAQSTAIASNLR